MCARQSIYVAPASGQGQVLTSPQVLAPGRASCLCARHLCKRVNHEIKLQLSGFLIKEPVEGQGLWHGGEDFPEASSRRLEAEP